MSFNIGSNVEMVHNIESHDHDEIALILMNRTFPEINIFPIAFSLDPLSGGTSMECTTAGFSLIGTHLEHPISELIRPTIYEFTAEFNLSKCKSTFW